MLIISTVVKKKTFLVIKMKTIPVKTFLILLLLHTQHTSAWVDPEEFVRMKAAAELRCPDNDNGCRQGERCVLLSHCKSECVGASKGLLQTDRQVARQIYKLG